DIDVLNTTLARRGAQILGRDALAPACVLACRSAEVWIQVRHALSLSGRGAASIGDCQRHAGAVGNDARELPTTGKCAHQEVVSPNTALTERQLVDAVCRQVLRDGYRRVRAISTPLVIRNSIRRGRCR